MCLPSAAAASAQEKTFTLGKFSASCLWWFFDKNYRVFPLLYKETCYAEAAHTKLGNWRFEHKQRWKLNADLVFNPAAYQRLIFRYGQFSWCCHTEAKIRKWIAVVSIKWKQRTCLKTFKTACAQHCFSPGCGWYRPHHSGPKEISFPILTITLKTTLIYVAAIRRLFK